MQILYKTYHFFKSSNRKIRPFGFLILRQGTVNDVLNENTNVRHLPQYTLLILDRFWRKKSMYRLFLARHRAYLWIENSVGFFNFIVFSIKWHCAKFGGDLLWGYKMWKVYKNTIKWHSMINDLGLLWLGFEHTSFRLRGERSSPEPKSLKQIVTAPMPNARH